MDVWSALEQVGWAAGYYFALIAMIRVAGKRLAGQTTTFDLLVLISLGVILQNVALKPGKGNGLLFILTVLALHIGLARAALHFPFLRTLVRENPRPLIKDGCILHKALQEEGYSEEELMAALRLQGFEDVTEVRLAVLEETGHVSAIRQRKRPKPALT